MSEKKLMKKMNCKKQNKNQIDKKLKKKNQ